MGMSLGTKGPKEKHGHVSSVMLSNSPTAAVERVCVCATRVCVRAHVKSFSTMQGIQSEGEIHF